MGAVKVYGITNELGNHRYAYYADYDGADFKFVKTKLKALLKHSGAGYACIIRTQPRHYHLIIPALFEAHEIAALHQISESDLSHVYYWFKHGRNALRITKKKAREKDFKLAYEATPNPFSAVADKLAEYLRLAYGATIPRCSEIKTRLNFVEYDLINGRGRVHSNKFLSSKEFKELLG